MFLVLTVDPAADNARRHWVLEGIFQIFFYYFFIKIVDYDKGCLAEILVSDGDFACHDVRQGVNERCRAREEVILFLYRRLIVRVGLQRRVSVEEDDGAVFARLETSVSFSI